MYETILTCPNCGAEHRLVADNVVAERDELRATITRLRNVVEVLMQQMERGTGGVRDEAWYAARDVARLALAQDAEQENA